MFRARSGFHFRNALHDIETKAWAICGDAGIAHWPRHFLCEIVKCDTNWTRLRDTVTLSSAELCVRLNWQQFVTQQGGRLCDQKAKMCVHTTLDAQLQNNGLSINENLFSDGAEAKELSFQNICDLKTKVADGTVRTNVTHFRGCSPNAKKDESNGC